MRDLRSVGWDELTGSTRRRDELLRVHRLLDQRLCRISRPVRDEKLVLNPDPPRPTCPLCIAYWLQERELGR
jgi:hypothetical protein